MDTDRLLEVAPHYVAMVLLVFLVLGVVRVVFGDLGFWIELAVIAVVVLAYPPGVKRLGVAPAAWENR